MFTLPSFAFILYCLCSIVVCQSRNEASFKFNIARRKYDKFRNLHCRKSELCTKEQCGIYGAQCVNDECKRCRCDSNRATFLVSGLSGNCTKDEDIVSESVPKESFMLKNREYEKCLTRQEGTAIAGKNCSSSLDMRWIQIKEDEDFKLMNVRTLQCLEFLQPECGESNFDTGDVAWKPCNRTDGQNIQVNIGSPISMQFQCLSSITGQNALYYLRLKMIPAYLAESIKNKNEQSWSVLGTDSSGRLTFITYTGCYRFQNEHSTLLYLDNRTTCRTNPCSHQFYSPIFMKNTNCRVHWTNSNISYGGVKWENIEEYFSKDSIKNLANLTSIENGTSKNMKILKINQEALHIFNGSLVKLAITCSGKNSHEQHCLLLKFRSPPTNKMGNMEPTKPITTIKLHEDGEKSSINPLVIAIPVSLLAVVLVLIFVYFVWYRKRRAQKEPENQAAPARYEYIDNNDIAKPAPVEQKYDYATVDSEIPSTTRDTKPASEELKYDYAANTDIPRINLNTKPAPEEQKYDYATVDSEIPSTTRDTKQAPEELKYDYAANSDIPRISFNTNPAPKGSAESPEVKHDYATVDSEISRKALDTKPAPEDVVDPPSNVYHTLEEPSPPQEAVYSTLEDPATETNPLL